MSSNFLHNILKKCQSDFFLHSFRVNEKHCICDASAMFTIHQAIILSMGQISVFMQTLNIDFRLLLSNYSNFNCRVVSLKGHCVKNICCITPVLTQHLVLVCIFFMLPFFFLFRACIKGEHEKARDGEKVKHII